MELTDSFTFRIQLTLNWHLQSFRFKEKRATRLRLLAQGRSQEFCSGGASH